MYPHKERCPVGCFCFGGNLWGFRQVERDPIPLLLCNPFPAQRAPRHGTWDIKGARKKSANVGNRTWLTRFRRDLVRKPDKSRCLDIQKVQLSNGFLFCNPKLRGRLNSNFMGSSFGSFVKYKKCTSLTSPWVRAGVPPPQTQRPLAFRGSTRESKHPAGVLWSKGVFRGAQKTSPLPGPLFGCEKKCRTRLAPFWHFYRTNDKLAGFSKKIKRRKQKAEHLKTKRVLRETRLGLWARPQTFSSGVFVFRVLDQETHFSMGLSRFWDTRKVAGAQIKSKQPPHR